MMATVNYMGAIMCYNLIYIYVKMLCVKIFRRMSTSVNIFTTHLKFLTLFYRNIYNKTVIVIMLEG